jgi:predicted ArsR family transcriptional regulator
VHAGATGPVSAELTAVYAVLAELGFEPRGDVDLILGNCPFHLLAQRQTVLICGLNEAFVNGILDGLGTRTLTAGLRPQPGGCCVRVAPSVSL